MADQNTDHTLDAWVDAARSDSFKNSMNYFAGDGVRLDFDINFAGGYIKKEDIKVYQVNPVTGARFEVNLVSVNGNSVRVDRVTPLGRNLVIYRDTDKRFPLVDFSDNSIVNERNLDLNAKQAIFAVAEMVDRFDDSVKFASEAAGAVELARAARDESIAAKVVSEAARDESVAAAAQSTAASSSATLAASQATKDAATASSASTTAVNAMQAAERSKVQAEAAQVTASAASVTATTSAAAAKADADRAKAAADSIDPAILNGRLDVIEGQYSKVHGLKGDLNTIVRMGSYMYEPGTPNAPERDFGLCLVTPMNPINPIGGGQWLFQLAHSVNTNKTFIRKNVNGDWGAWARLYSSNDLTFEF